EMERYTFTDPDVQAALSAVVLLRADVTHNDADDQALLKRFGIFGPPTIAFYGADGEERTQYRVVGYMKAQALAARTRAALHTPPSAIRGLRLAGLPWWRSPPRSWPAPPAAFWPPTSRARRGGGSRRPRPLSWIRCCRSGCSPRARAGSWR